MRIHISFLLLVFFPVFSFSQDLIVTQKGDSLNCSISKVKNDFIYFTFKHDNEVRNTLLATEDVKSYTYDFWEVPVLTDTEIKKPADYQVVRLALNTGYSYRTAPLADNISSSQLSYYKSLKSGFHVGGDISAFTSEAIGFGFKYNLFKSKGNSSGDNNEKISIHFVGPSFTTRLLNYNKRNAFISNWSIGYMSYVDKLYNGYEQVQGSTVGLAWDLGYDFKISEKTALGFQISLLSGVLNKVTYKEGMHVQEIELDNDEREGLGRVDFSVGLRF